MQADRTWHLEIDAANCDGHGICALCCPDRIGLDEWGYASVNTEPIVDGRTLARAHRAVAACPERALVLRSSDAGASRRREPVARRAL